MPDLSKKTIKCSSKQPVECRQMYAREGIARYLLLLFRTCVRDVQNFDSPIIVRTGIQVALANIRGSKQLCMLTMIKICH